jgi:hypothetical protein
MKRHVTSIRLIAASSVLWSASSVFAYEWDAKHATVSVSSLPDFDQCERHTGDSDACLVGLNKYVQGHAAEAFAAGKRVRLHYNHSAALPYFAKAIGKATAAQCGDEDLALAVVSGLELPTDDPNAALAQRIISGTCWQAMRTRVVAGLKDGGAYYRANVCPELKKRAIEQAECVTTEPAQAKAVEPAPLRSAKVAGLNPRTLTTDAASVMVFRGSEKEEVLFIRATKPNDVALVKFKSVRGPWNGRVFATLQSAAGIGYDYVANVDGRDRVVMTVRDGDYEVYPSGYRDGVPVSRQRLADETKAAAPADVVKEFATSTP